MGIFLQTDFEHSRAHTDTALGGLRHVFSTSTNQNSDEQQE